MMSAQPAFSASQTTLQRHGLLALGLWNFRHVREDHLPIDGRPVLLSGANGVGKTNILEAVSLLSPGRGVRSASSEQFLNVEAELTQGWQIKAKLCGSGYMLRTAWQAPQVHRGVFIEDEKISQQRMGDYCRTLALGPRDDQLYVQGDEAIRRFMDRLIAVFDPEHVGRVQHLRKLQKQWRELLDGDRPADPLWLSALEKQLAERMVVVTAARLRQAQTLGKSLQSLPDLVARIMGNSASGVQYHWQIDLGGEIAEQLVSQPAIALEEALCARLKSLRTVGALASLADIWSFTLAGGKRAISIHDLSYGQQKMGLLAFVLAQAFLMREALGQVPIILLDEATNQLDDYHAGLLFAHLQMLDCQYWISGVDLSRWSKQYPEALYWSLSERTGEVHVT